MTVTAPAAPVVLCRQGRGPARRVMVRWAWRLFRREWRRQALILALLTLAVAATTVGLAVASNASAPKNDPNFGSANTIASLPGNDPQLAADLAILESRFGVADVVAHQSVPIPGSVATVDLRAEDPNGTYLKPTVRLDTGRLPSGPGQVAVTSAVAQEFGLRVGGSWHEGGHTWTVVGLVENPLDLNSQFALVAPGQADPPLNVTMLVNATNTEIQHLNT
ncbi:MAG: ABC transporter permease, partial [Acidimicrobiales bacterium]